MTVSEKDGGCQQQPAELYEGSCGCNEAANECTRRPTFAVQDDVLVGGADHGVEVHAVSLAELARQTVSGEQAHGFHTRRRAQKQSGTGSQETFRNRLRGTSRQPKSIRQTHEEKKKTSTCLPRVGEKLQYQYLSGISI